MKVSAGNRSTSSSSTRQVTVQVTGLARNDYARSSDVELHIPFTRFNETLQMVNRMGGKITSVSVTGEGTAASAKPAAPRKSNKRPGAPAEG
ncbi:phycobilisome linker polypeptide [Cyanobium sp. Morenito 9A2]|uniref:phycobilisome linker polypeptide n=1 Tax=Cyanobium sp. Morenito 9A2 TaxID=2823718 RepID=UPI0020CD6733|nr:phycobilisome linker polypeptide [Cyanobium sp. Morenito 9A2]MCP9851176.1 CpcD/allophycocyanin linker domain-containing protein [Cyanobium sp. Morenito 9A2]